MTSAFTGLGHEAALGPADTVRALLDDALRGYVPLRKVFVQWPNDHTTRPNQLAKFVSGRQERALDALLLLHAFMPILEGTPLPLATWARALSLKAPCTPTGAARAFATLEAMNLVEREQIGKTPIIKPLLEDGSGATWTHPGALGADVGKGYFTLPHAYWTAGYAASLGLPGKAMLLIMLAETTQKPSFSMAVERASDWYGISERTAERGYIELTKAGLMDSHVQYVADARSPIGRRTVHHRALKDPFSTDERQRLQRAAGAAARRAAKKQKKASP